MNVATTDEGYLRDPRSWTPEIALVLADQEHLELTPIHWEIIQYARQYYLEHQRMPKMRELISHLRASEAFSSVTSSSIQHLFPLSPALQIAKIAGLPKPAKCL